MTCSIEGCERPIRYAARQICQLHYFRFRRNGTYEIVRKPREELRRTNPGGYQQVYAPEHPLAMSDGFVYEHRAVVYAQFGDNLPDCEICGAPTDWATCHIDHRNDERADNRRENLRPLCPGCNTGRAGRSTTPRYEYAGNQLTLTELMELPGVQVCREQARQRLMAGWSVEQALFGAKRTHNGKRNQKLGTGHKHHALEIDGVTKNLRDWSRTPGCDLSSNGIALRLRAGWDAKAAVFTPRANAGRARLRAATKEAA